VGANAFSHTGGIHQDGVLKLPSTYEIIRASSVGFPSSHIILGKLSGRHALSKRLSTFGFSFTKEELEEIYKKFKEIANKKKYVYDEDLYALGEELLQEKGKKNYYTLEYLHVTCGKDIMPTATIRLRKDNEVYHAAACGNGPVDATYKAIDEITKKKMKLLDYTLRALSADRDALGEVTLRVKYKKRIAIGKGSSTDIVEASAKAYLSAINRLLF
jgi:2-isopropylmalate synthase